MTRPFFILASSSPRRLALLESIGLKPDKVIHANIDESPLSNELPRQQAKRLALAKLKAVPVEANALVLAADTVVACGRRVLPKPKTPDEVARCLRLLSGRRHHVFTGVAIRTPDGRVHQKLADSIVAFRQLTPHDIDRYVESGEGIGKAGGYAIQGCAATFIRFISGSYSNIVGLPLYEVGQIVEKYFLSP